MIGLDGRPEIIGEGADAMLVPMERHGVKVMSMGFLVDADTPVIWRGPMIGQAVTEASLLRDHLATLPDGGRRVGELLVADIGRLRALVDDLETIAAAARQLFPVAEPPDELWKQIEMAIQDEEGSSGQG